VSGSRIAAARARAQGAKLVLVLSAGVMFLAAAVLAAWSRPGSPVRHARAAVTASVASSSDDSDLFGESEDDDWGSGAIAPVQSTPQVTTGSS
jgi:hypothetical protein